MLVCDTQKEEIITGKIKSCIINVENAIKKTDGKKRDEKE